jgi:hypothetical protein
MQADRLLMREREPGLSTIVAHTACEVATQRAFAHLFKTQNLETLGKGIEKFFSSYNLEHTRVRDIYAALTNDDITAQPWWADCAASVQRRNRVVHKGVPVDESDRRIDQVA